MYCKNCFTDNTEIIPKTREEWTCHRNFRRPKQAASSTHSFTVMAIPVVEFSNQGYKIKNNFA